MWWQKLEGLWHFYPWMETVFASKLDFCLLLSEKNSEVDVLPPPSVTRHSSTFLPVRMSLPVRGGLVGSFMMAGERLHYDSIAAYLIELRQTRKGEAQLKKGALSDRLQDS